MTSQKGSPLSSREEVTGRLDPPADLRPVAQRVREDATYTAQPKTDPDRNPYAVRVEQLQRMSAHTQGDKAHLARRVMLAQKSSDEWESGREAERAIERRNTDEKVLTMRDHANFAFSYVQRDPTASRDEVMERQRLRDLAESNDCSPSDYWKASNDADRRWFKRLDSIADEKKAVANEAKAEHAEAREVAKDARTVDRSADDPTQPNTQDKE